MRSTIRDVSRAAAAMVIAALASVTVLAESSLAEGQNNDRGSIKVSGYWNIDVLSPDGSVASHTEFENALRPEGGVALAQLLGGRVRVATLFINLDGSTHPCGTTNGFGCLLVFNSPDSIGTGGIFSGQTIFPTLVPSASTSEPYSLVLTGVATIPAGGTIGVVQTGVVLMCPNAPAVCALPGDAVPILSALPKVPFTEFTLPTPITVQNGQVVSVTVTLSFSTPPNASPQF